MTILNILKANGLMTIQDMGRPGYLAQGLSRGGAMDRLALVEAAALLGASRILPAIEMACAGGTFSVSETTRIALTGAPMKATLDGIAVDWNCSLQIEPKQILHIGGATEGLYSYLTPAGGLMSPQWLESYSTHLTIGVGSLFKEGSCLLCGRDPNYASLQQRIEKTDRFGGGLVRVLDGPQTALFTRETLDTFYATTFTRAVRGNRQGVQLDSPHRFTSSHASGLASDVIGPGDIQMTGDGLPYILMAECQTMGGYPRIGTIFPNDLPILAQAVPGTELRFQRMDLDEAEELYRDEVTLIDAIKDKRTPARSHLMSCQLVSGVTDGDCFVDAFI
nr:biotin-dependent carboxyltransferase family protein [uncultured Cohaesibacter sp.]